MFRNIETEQFCKWIASIYYLFLIFELVCQIHRLIFFEILFLYPLKDYFYHIWLHAVLVLLFIIKLILIFFKASLFSMLFNIIYSF